MTNEVNPAWKVLAALYRTREWSLNTWPEKNMLIAAYAGTYTLTASAVDSVAGGSAQGQANGVIVASDTIPPTLNITTPTSGSLLSGRSIGFAATASDASGVKSVAFYVDTTLLATLTTAPYSANLNTRKLAAGAHTLRARATDGAGNVTEQSVAVTIK